MLIVLIGPVVFLKVLLERGGVNRRSRKYAHGASGQQYARSNMLDLKWPENDEHCQKGCPCHRYQGC